MAGDWLRVRHDILEDPDLVGIAAALGLTEDEALGKLFRFWRYADRHSADGFLAVSAAWMDRHVGVTLFCHALVTVGWLRERDGGLELPDFDRYMGHSSKSRAVAAERQKRHRDSKTGVRNASASRSQRDKSVTREEKRREEKREDPQSPPAGGGASPSLSGTNSPDQETPRPALPSDQATAPLKGNRLLEAARFWPMPALLGEPFRGTWLKWVGHLAGMTRKPTESQLRSHLEKLGAQGSQEAATHAVDWCVDNGASGFSPRVLEISREKAVASKPSDNGLTREELRKLGWLDLEAQKA